MESDWERAAANGDAEWARSILEAAGGDSARRAICNSKDRHGQTALMLASARGHVELVRLLVEDGAELDHTAKYHLSALMLAVINRHAEIARVLVGAGADREIRGTGAPGFAGLTAMDLAEKAGYDEIAALLRAASG
jgi:ankyrin repeat protein